MPTFLSFRLSFTHFIMLGANSMFVSVKRKLYDALWSFFRIPGVKPLDISSTFSGVVTSTVLSTGFEPIGPTMNLTLSWNTRRSAAVLPPWPVYWSSYISSSIL